MVTIFPAPKRYFPGYARKHVSVSSIITTCPVNFGARLHHTALTYRHDPALPEQGFRISFPDDGVVIEYSDLPGIRYAHLALNQLIDTNAAVKEDAVIEDWPDFPTRSVLLDISRDRVPTMSTLKRLIDYFSALRFNQFQLYTEHTFAYQKHATVWQDYSPMTAEEIREVDAYCQQVGIELVANQAAFGHMEKWLCHPEYQHLAEQTTGFQDQRGDFRPGAFGLNPISEQTAIFVNELLSEVTPNFSSDIINLNFDETMDLGVGASKSACEIFGKGKVFLNYLNKVLEIAESKGKQCQIFSDMLFRYPNLIDQLPDNLTLLNWGYEADHPFDAEHKQLALFGYPFHVVVSTDCFASVAGRWSTATTHMRRAAKSAKRFRADGYMVTEWGDMGHGQQHAMPIPGYAFAAAMAWGEEQQTDDDMTIPVSWYYPDISDVELSTLIALQDIYRSTGIETPNCAFFGPILFDQQSGRHIKRMKGLAINNLDHTLAELKSWKEKLAPLPDNELRNDLLWTVDALEIGCFIAQGYGEGEHRDVQKFGVERKQMLQARLRPLIQGYRELWLEHYRPGGMAQSSSRLEYLSSLLSLHETNEIH
ncbi:family 20 glycosylhydrolase [Grimontia sp. NTOU-MAR1]|uniref:family 20 glycosylhydrolase n=1 Tax=Grimontia sp. NTOU-MAR1 TaxID=3111011 RepID=UPI002DB71F39|nr:family 20 glycosylhydrolase [Grimontia sp. NTOU-MAR1]WRW00940.1 family 20 glycosylhydrolase [Grimontia sp. NTOU-MAR1]